MTTQRSTIQMIVKRFRLCRQCDGIGALFQKPFVRVDCFDCDGQGFTESLMHLTITGLVTIDRSPGWEHQNETGVEDMRVVDDSTWKTWRGELTPEEQRWAAEKLINAATERD